MATSAKTEHTERSIQSLDNDQLLSLFAIVGDDIYRRIRVYGDATTPAALLDGLKFVKKADDIAMTLMSGELRDFNWGLFYARDTFLELLSEASFDDDFEGVDLDA